MKTYTTDGGVNVILSFTNQGGWYKKWPRRFYFKGNELLKHYLDWDILRYKKMWGGTKLNVAQARAMIAARKI